MSSRYLPVVVLVVGTALSVAAAWGGYLAFDEPPQAQDLVDLTKRMVRPRTLPPETSLREAEPRGTRPAVVAPMSKPAADPPRSPLPDSAPLVLSADAQGMVVRAMSLAADGTLYVALAKPTIGTLCGLREAEGRGEIWSYDPDGRRIARWPVRNFTPQAVLATPDGMVYAGGQGLVARFSPAREEQEPSELISRRNLVLLRGQAKVGVGTLTRAIVAQWRESVAMYDRHVARVERTIAEARVPRPSLKEMSASITRVRDAMKSELAALELASSEENEEAIIDRDLRVDRIVLQNKDLFILNNGAVERWSTIGGLKSLVLPREGGKAFLDLRVVGDELLVQSRWGVFERYGPDGKRLESTCLVYDRRSADYLEEKSGLRIHLNGPFAVVNENEMLMPDAFGNVVRWTTSGRMVDVFLSDAVEPRPDDLEIGYLFAGDLRTDSRAGGQNRILEASSDGSRIYLSAVGSTKIDRLRPKPGN
jgi:hypothetical protein